LILRPPALSQIENKRDTLVAAFFEARHTDQHGHTAAILPEVLLLERLQAPGHLQLRDPPPPMPVEPFRGRKVRPAQAARDKILTVVSHHAKKRVIGLKNPTSKLPDDDPNDVGVDQTSDLRFPFLKFAIQTTVFQRNRRLRREQLEDRDPPRR